MGPQKKV